MLIKLLKVISFIGLLFTINMVLIRMVFRILSKKYVLMYPIVLTGLVVGYIIYDNKTEDFEPVAIPTEGNPIEQEEDLKTDIQTNLKTLLNDMVEKTKEQGEIMSVNEPKPSTNTSLVRTELTREPESIMITKQIAANQIAASDTVAPQAMISMVEEEPRPIEDLRDFVQTKEQTVIPVEDWLKPDYKSAAMKTGCMCPISPMWGSNFAELQY